MIRVFIGTEEAQWLPTQVLKYSIASRSKAEYDFRDLKDISLNLQHKMFTGFSFYRWAIPELCGFEGRAIYLDADMVVLDDLEKMFNLDMQGKGALARPFGKIYHTSAMLLDCSALKHWKINDWVKLINAGIASYKDIMMAGPNSLNHKDFGNLPEYWNHLDECNAETKLIHYTTVPDQPWKKPGHKHAYVFLKELKSALEKGVISKEEVDHEAGGGHIYPSLYMDAMKL